MKRVSFAIIVAGIAAMLPLGATSPTHSVSGTQHDLTGTGTGPIKSTVTDSCLFCHAPHNVIPNVTPLWDQTLSSQTYTTYTSSTYTSGAQTPGAGSSKLCLSCHDGTVAVGLTVAKGQLPTTGTTNPADIFGSNLAKSHPVSMTAVDDGTLASTLFATPPSTKDPAVRLDAGKTECITCHDPHVQNNDSSLPMFLVRTNTSGAICLACHDPTRVQPNTLNGWTTGAHATSTDTVPTIAGFGAYGNVAANACSNCHGAHNNSAAPRSLRASEEADCSPCHGGANVSPALPNIMTEFTKTYSHPTTTVSGVHDPAEAIPVNTTRHAECPDCHNMHTAYAQSGTALAPTIQSDLAGVSGYDTSGVQKPAAKEYQVCLNCHGDSTNKPTTSTYGRTAARYPNPPGTTLLAKLVSLGVPGSPPVPADPYNIRLKFMSTISHNVMGYSIPTTLNTTLRPYMLNVDGTSNTNRPLSATTQIYCTDCHSNDQARSFKGTGPNGPHGSANIHLLQLSLYQDGVTGTGGSSASSSAGYALCNKCHNVNDATGTPVKKIGPHNGNHNSVACTTCHDPHGVIGGNPVANFALINFDTYEVKAGSSGYGLYATRSGATVTGGCYLNCHGQNHSNNGFNGD